MKQLSLLMFLILTQLADAQNWSLTGNAGTTTGTNFIGTTDARALMFKVNSQRAGLIDLTVAKANTSFGFQALLSPTGTNNAAFGYKASFSNTTGNYNTAAGAYALYFNTSGRSNVAMGIGALYRNTTSSNLVALGDSALYNNSGGVFNSATGSKALYANTAGTDNAANGYRALTFNTTGSYNSATGSNALVSNTTGNYNTGNGYQTLYLNTAGNQNTAVGYQSLYRNTASLNTGVGYRALYYNTSGSFNSALGTFSLYNNSTGYSNAAFGYSSLNANTTGYYNTAVGSVCLFQNTTGYTNTAMGHYAMYTNSTGAGNNAYGADALYYNTTGSYNTGLGVEALKNNTTGNGNTAVGVSALFPNVGSYYNTAVGYLALAYAGTPGYNNVAIGAFSGPDINTEGVYNSIAIGEECYTTASNQARIGNSFTTSIGGYANWTNISDGRVKENIKRNVPGLAFINKLNPVTYNVNPDAISSFVGGVRKDKDGKILAATSEETAAKKAKQQVVYTGFVAQEVEKAAKEMGYDFSGVDAPANDKGLYGLRYAEFVVPLVKAVQELSAENDALKTKNDALEERLEKIEALLSNQQPGSQALVNAGYTGTASISQNMPNPVANSTTINYNLPVSSVSAKIVVMDKTGKTLQSITLSAKGRGSVQVDAASLSAGAYNYALYVDGKLIDTKQMLVAR